MWTCDECSAMEKIKESKEEQEKREREKKVKFRNLSNFNGYFRYFKLKWKKKKKGDKEIRWGVKNFNTLKANWYKLVISYSLQFYVPVNIRPWATPKITVVLGLGLLRLQGII